MAAVFVSYLLFSTPAKPQEGYTLKERVDQIYQEVKETNSFMNTKFDEMKKEILMNRERIRVLEIYIWFIGVIAGGLGSIIGATVTKFLTKRINNTRTGMDKVDWNKKK
jgi:hypothetical protein